MKMKRRYLSNFKVGPGISIDKKNLRMCSFTNLDKAMMHPEDFCRTMQANGFIFDRVGCPYKLAMPWSILQSDDGTITYSQWDE